MMEGTASRQTAIGVLEFKIERLKVELERLERLRDWLVNAGILSNTSAEAALHDIFCSIQVR